VKYLLDTEVWLWMQAHPERIGRHAMNILTDDRNELFLSAASSWEIAQKFRRGRLRLPEPPDEYVPDRLLTSGVDGLSIEHSHALAVSRLDHRRHDPVDRLLIGQATIEHLPIISSDPRLAVFDIEFIDATT
jgi:PIN domain nuclease of toxin-antitoxin system